MDTRPQYWADKFYPNDSMVLNNIFTQYFAKVQNPKIEGKIRAVIVPHAGYRYSGEVASYAYALLKDRNIYNYLIIGPSHRLSFIGLGILEYTAWESPFGVLKIKKIQEKLQNIDGFVKLNPEEEREHSIEVQVPFIKWIATNAEIVPFMSGIVENHEEYSDAIFSLLDPTSVLVISSDLSHYHPYKECQLIDRVTIDKILQYKEVSHNEACGTDGINILINIARTHGWKSKLLKYLNSGDTEGGDKSGVVGYASIVFYE